MSYADVVKADSPLGFWPLDTGVHDVMGLTTPSVTGTVTFNQSGPFGLKSALFDGSTGFVNLGNPSAFNAAGMATTWSIEAWVCPLNVTPNGCGVLSTVYFGGNIQFELGFGLGGTAAGVPDLYVYDGVNHNSSGGSAVLGQWMHMVGTRDPSVFDLYINGSLVHSQGLGGGVSGGTGYLIGRRHDTSVGSASYFNGNIAMAAVYNTTISPTTIQRHYNEMIRSGVTLG